MQITIEAPGQPDIIQLIAELDAYQTVLYPPESHHGIDIAALGAPHVVFAVARTAEGEAMGCGAVVLGEQAGELKRMFVRPQCRGQGLAKAILSFLEGAAVQRGCMLLRLETGISQPEALSLYDRSGYLRRGPFDDYIDDPLSVFMEKRIAN